MRNKIRRELQVNSGITMTGGSMHFGGSANYNSFAASTGRQLMYGTGRVIRDISLFPGDFLAATTSGSMTTASMLVDISGSVFADTAASLSFNYIYPSAKVTASPTCAFAPFTVPRDADTTGSVTVWVEWTCPTTTATAGSKCVLHGGIAYFGSGSTVRTAASTGACVAYNNTTALKWVSSSLGTLPSFNANDTWGVFVLRNDLSDAGETIGGSAIRVSAVRLSYVANSLGDASTE